MKLSKRDRTIFGALLFLLLAGGVYWFYVKPAQAQVQTLNATLDESNQKLSTAQSALSTAKSKKIDEAAVSTSRFQYAKAVPVGIQTFGSMTQLQDAAERANVIITSSQQTDKQSLGTLRSQSFSLDVKGKFFDIDSFLYTVQHFVELDDKDRLHVHGRLFVVTKIDMHGVSSNGAAAPTPGVRANTDITATIEMTAVNQPRPDEVSAAPAAGGATATPTPTPTAAPATAPAAAPATGGTR